MTLLGKIIQHLLTLITGILLLGYKIIRQVILPSGGKKGNLLSSLFVFIVGILEGLIQFERNLLKTPMLFRNKYVRQGLQIATAIFLFIASFEWSAGNAPINNQTTLQSVQHITCAPVRKNYKYRPIQSQTQVSTPPCITSGCTLYNRNTSANTKKYLLICCFRI